MGKRRITKAVREFEPLLFRNGFRYTRTKGSHLIYTNHETNKTIAVNKDLKKVVRERLIKENKLI